MQRRTIMILIAAVLILVTIGVVMLFSASMVRGESQYQDTFYFLVRQLIWMILSLIAATLCAQIDLSYFKKAALPLAGVCALALILVRIPGVGVCINGSWRWIRVAGLTIQPSEFSKIGIILLFAWWISTNRRHMPTFKRGVLFPGLTLGFFSLLFMVEPDFGSTMLVGSVVMMLLYVGGAKPGYLNTALLGGGILFAIVLWQNANRMRRIVAFLDPEKYQLGEAWQLINALNAFASGGLWGSGLGDSIQKQFYLPEAHTDFIFPIIGEELGLAATLLVLILFIVIFFCGLRISRYAADDFGKFVALGITLMITLQATINLAVVTGCMPTKGLALPFISYGGSSLLVCSSMIGLLVNIAHTSRSRKAQKKAALFKDQCRIA